MKLDSIGIDCLESAFWDAEQKNRKQSNLTYGKTLSLMRLPGFYAIFPYCTILVHSDRSLTPQSQGYFNHNREYV